MIKGEPGFRHPHDLLADAEDRARTANPGGRIPRRRSLTGPVTITVDTRERFLTTALTDATDPNPSGD